MRARTGRSDRWHGALPFQGDAAQGFHHRVPGLGVERRSGLVANHELRIMDQHPGDRDALFKAVIADKCASLSPPESFQKLAESGPAPCLARIAEGFTDLITHPDVIAMHRVVTSEAARNPRIAQLLYEAGPERYKSALAALLQNFHNRGELQVPDPDLACEQFFHMLKGEYHQRLLLNLKPKATREERRNYARACVGVFLRAYGGNTEGGSGTGGGQEPCR